MEMNGHDSTQDALTSGTTLGSTPAEIAPLDTDERAQDPLASRIAALEAENRDLRQRLQLAGQVLAVCRKAGLASAAAADRVLE